MYTIMTDGTVPGIHAQKTQVRKNLRFVHLQGLEPWTP